MSELPEGWFTPPEEKRRQQWLSDEQRDLIAEELRKLRPLVVEVSQLQERIAELERQLAKAKREGAVEELGELLLWGPTHISAREVLAIKEYRDEIRRRIAALEVKE